jgi:hypothetical protein
MTETYEQLRDGLSGEAGQAWRQADMEESNLRALYRSLEEDPRYTTEHKAEKAWESYEAAREKIVAGREKARESLRKQAQTGERLSIPLPDGEHLITTDTAKLLASQNEATRIIRKLERSSAPAQAGPFRPNRAEALKEEYSRGLEIGGMQGGVICRGVLMAADELGVDTNAVVDEFRKPRHREILEKAGHAERVADLIGTRLKVEPPFPRPGSRAAARVGAPVRLLVPRSAPLPGQQAVREPGHGGRGLRKARALEALLLPPHPPGVAGPR